MLEETILPKHLLVEIGLLVAIDVENLVERLNHLGGGCLGVTQQCHQEDAHIPVDSDGRRMTGQRAEDADALDAKALEWVFLLLLILVLHLITLPSADLCGSLVQSNKLAVLCAISRRVAVQAP